MDMRFTRHALERMLERDISEAQVLSALAAATEAKPSNNKPGVYVAATRIDGRVLKVVFNPAERVVITVCWAGKKKGAGYGKEKA